MDSCASFATIGIENYLVLTYILDVVKR